VIKRNLVVLILANSLLVLAFVLSYDWNKSLVPLFVGALSILLSNFICVREFIAPTPDATAKPLRHRPVRMRDILPLLIMPFFFCITLQSWSGSTVRLLGLQPSAWDFLF
jgi:hypothetical protein